MDGPGISLFQGSDSLEIGTNSQEDEEDEALEEEKRRNDELRDLISNAFDDLIDDDQSFANSSRPLSSNDTADQGESFDDDHHVESMPDRPTSDYQKPTDEVNDEKQGVRGIKHIGYYGTNNSTNFSAKESQFMGGGDTNVSAQHYKHCTKLSPAIADLCSTGLYQYAQENNEENLDEKYLKADYNSMEQLKVLYDVRVREIQRLHNEVDMTTKHNKLMEMQLKRRLALMEAEKERAVLSLKESQNLLVTSKAQIEDLEKQIVQQKTRIEDLEESNFELTTQLDIAKSSVVDLQNRISFLEKNDSSRKKELENDSYVRLIEDRHRKELSCLQEQVQVAKVKLERKEAEFTALEMKVKEVTKSLENTVADKTEVINRLARSLEESQARCEQLMSSKLGQENFELRMQLSGERSEKEALQGKISSLQKSVDMLQSDIRNYEAVTRLGMLNSESLKDSDSIVQLGIAGGSQLATRTLDPITDVNVKLREELKRSLIGQRIKREEIKRLQMELEARDMQIQDMQLQESKYLTEAENFKVHTQQLLQQLKKESATNVSNPKSRYSNSEKELSLLQEEIKKCHAERKILISEKERLEKANESMTSENVKLLSKIEDIAKIKEKEKMEAIDRFQNEYLTFHDQAIARLRAEKNEPLEKEINELRKQLEEALKEVDDAKKSYLEILTNKDSSRNRESDRTDLVNVLKQQLAEEKEAFAKFREIHENILQQKCESFKSESAKYIKEMEEKSRLLYEKKVAEEIEKAKEETLKELEIHYQSQVDKMRNEIEEEMLAKQKSLLDNEVGKIRNEIMKDNMKTKDCDEKTTELFKECCRLREELNAKQDYWNREMERIKIEAEKEKLDKLRNQQREIEEKLGQEFREQLKKAESTREQAAKMLKEQLEAEQTAFLQKYEEKLHEYSLKVKSHSTRSIGTSPPNLDDDEIDCNVNKDAIHWEKLLEEKEKMMNEVTFKKVAEAERKARLEAEAQYSGNLDVFRTLMEGKAREVDEIRTAMAMERNRLKAALVEAKTAATDTEVKTRKAYEDILKNKDAETEKLKEQVLLLSKELEKFDVKAAKEKDMMAQVMARWAAEVQEMKAARKDEDKKLMHVYRKYQDIKKTVAAYKAFKDEHFKNEHKKLVENFSQALNTVEERMKEVCAKNDATQVQKIAAIEASFEKKSEKLRQKINHLNIKEKAS